MTTLKRGDPCTHRETGEPARYVGATYHGTEIVACEGEDFERLCEAFDWRERARANERLAVAVGRLRVLDGRLL